MALDEGWSGTKPTGNHTHFATGDDTNIRVGSIYGARSFYADPDTGWLSGVTYRKNWTPGINTAECWKITGWSVLNVGVVPHHPGKKFQDRLTGRLLERDGNKFPETEREFLGWEWKLGNETGVTKVEPIPHYGNNTADHDLAQCHCGFHGYLRGSLDFATDRNAVNGIVRAFGRVRVGKRGFRAQHAEITALYVPDTAPEKRPYRPAEFEPVSQGLAFAAKVQPAELVEKISARYPAVPIYTDLDSMLALHELESP